MGNCFDPTRYHAFGLCFGAAVRAEALAHAFIGTAGDWSFGSKERAEASKIPMVGDLKSPTFLYGFEIREADNQFIGWLAGYKPMKNGQALQIPATIYLTHPGDWRGIEG